MLSELVLCTVFACPMAEIQDTKQEAAEALQVEPVMAETVMVTDAEVPAQTQPRLQGRFLKRRARLRSQRPTARSSRG